MNIPSAIDMPFSDGLSFGSPSALLMDQHPLVLLSIDITDGFYPTDEPSVIYVGIM